LVDFQDSYRSSSSCDRSLSHSCYFSIDYLYSPQAQQEFVEIGYRPADSSLLQDKTQIDKYPVIKTLATAKDYGGWTNIQKQFFAERAIFDQVLSKR
jgi:ABC-type sulfate transport system substrate-binding protein